MNATVTLHRLSGRLPRGVDGLVRAIATTHPALDLHAHRVLSGAAFRTYQLNPDDNWAYRTSISAREFAWGTLDMESYGVLESLSTHLQRDLRIWTPAKPADVIALLQTELGEQRQVIVNLDALAPNDDNTLRRTPDRNVSMWGLVSAIQTPKLTTTLPLPEGVDEEGMTLTFDMLAKDAAALPLAFITARAPYEPVPDTRATALRDDVLRFANLHYHSKRELQYRDELYYASGGRAWSTTAELCTTRLPDSADEQAALRTYLRAWLQDLADARHAAATIDDDVHAAFIAAATAAEAAAARTEDAPFDTLAQAITTAEKADANAFDALHTHLS